MNKSEILVLIFTIIMFLSLLLDLIHYVKLANKHEDEKNELLEAQKQQTQSLLRQDAVIELYNSRINSTPNDWDAIDRLRTENHKV